MSARKVKSNKVFVAMSGGVDSSVSAALLKKDGYDVTGIFMMGWQAPDTNCTFRDDRIDAMRSAAELGIKFRTYDFSNEYFRCVVKYMIDEYKNGRTPNPDVMCNKNIKFGLFFDRALKEGADYIATGHYVKGKTTQKSDGEEEFTLYEARDKNKDQSYFLWMLNQKVLRKTIFPLANYKKKEVRDIARTFNLHVSEKKDSQGVCFVGKVHMGDFLRKYINEKRGSIVNTAGEVIGEHSGAHFYTIGQRRGIGISRGVPYYVAAKNLNSNLLIMSDSKSCRQMYSDRISAYKLHFICHEQMKSRFECLARIRYRQKKQNVAISIKKSGRIDISFKTPQWAVAEGQSVVLYDGERMLGGAIIDKIIK